MMTSATVPEAPGRLGKLLQGRRKALNLSVSEVAIRAGVSYFRVYFMERRGGARVDLDTLGLVAGALGITAEDLGAALWGRADSGGE